MIYFVQPVEGGPVKIGTSTDVVARVRQLEAYYGCELTLLGVMEGGREEERQIHERFSHLRFGRTEQFQPAADLMEFIGRPLFVNATPVFELLPAEGAPKTLFSIKGVESWHNWIREYAESRAMSVTALIDFALSEQAKRDGFPKPMPKRTK